jgi:hypothetical protein
MFARSWHWQYSGSMTSDLLRAQYAGYEDTLSIGHDTTLLSGYRLRLHSASAPLSPSDDTQSGVATASLDLTCSPDPTAGHQSNSDSAPNTVDIPRPGDRAAGTVPAEAPGGDLSVEKTNLDIGQRILATSVKKDPHQPHALGQYDKKHELQRHVH